MEFFKFLRWYPRKGGYPRKGTNGDTYATRGSTFVIICNVLTNIIITNIVLTNYGPLMAHFSMCAIPAFTLGLLGVFFFLGPFFFQFPSSLMCRLLIH